MRPFHWLPLLAATALITGCAVYPAPVAGPAPVVYNSPVPVTTVAPYPYYATPYPYPYAYGYGPGYYGPPVLFSGSLVYRSGPGFRRGFGPGFRGGAAPGRGGLHLVPRSVPGR